MLDNMWISDKTVLKLVANILRKTPSPKGYKINTKHRGVQTISHDDVIRFVEELAEAAGNGDYGAIHHCKTCGHFSRAWCKGGRGYCGNSASGYRNSTDYCSEWIPQTEQQKCVGRKLDELRLQDERVGDGSEDSNEGN